MNADLNVNFDHISKQNECLLLKYDMIYNFPVSGFFGFLSNLTIFQYFWSCFVKVCDINQCHDFQENYDVMEFS